MRIFYLIMMRVFISFCDAQIQDCSTTSASRLHLSVEQLLFLGQNGKEAQARERRKGEHSEQKCLLSSKRAEKREAQRAENREQLARSWGEIGFVGLHSSSDAID